MTILEGKHNGFCFGVQSAVQSVESALLQRKPVFTLGPIIHNEAEVGRLGALGAQVAVSPQDVPLGACVVIRSHGVAPPVMEALRERECEIIDATCPFVARIQVAVAKAHARGQQVLIIGQREHPEIVAIGGHCLGQAIIAGSVDELREQGALPTPLFVVAQTTLEQDVYQEVERYLQSLSLEFEMMQTICRATIERQQEAEDLSKQCDAMLVIGGKHSANTRKLLDICKKNCEKSIILEGGHDVSVEKCPINGIIGIIAGASTPQWSIREVIARMNEQDLNTPIVEQEQVDVTPSQPETPEVEVRSEDAVEVVEAAQPQVAEQVEAPAQADVAEPAAEAAAQATEPEADAEQAQAEPERELTAEEAFERDLEKSLVRIRPGQIKKGTVVQIVGDDVFVNIGYKADGVIPQSELSLDPKASAAEMLAVGDEVSVEIIKVNDGEGNVLLSKKAVDRRNADRDAIASLADGAPFEVTIHQAVKSGVLTEYRGARVFIPASQLADRYVENLEEFINKKLLVKAIEVDKSRRRVVASHRQVLRDQLVAARKEKYAQFEAGQKVKGTVRRITDFGAFTDIGGVDGLVHVTDLSHGRVQHPSDVVSVGDEIEVLILSVNAETERIALGYKQLQPRPWDNAAERYLVGDIVEGKVDRIAPFGAFVELEPGLFGLVHISQVATRRIEKVEDELRVGDIITIKVMEVDPAAKRISLSRRAVLQPEREQRSYEPSQGGEDSFQARYEIPPMEEAKVSLADLFQDAFKDAE